ncbi:unnamed protein product [Urochloa humidicola]
MSPGSGAKKRLGVTGLGVVGGRGFGLGCGCRDAKAVAVAASASSASPYSATSTDTSTATTATWRGGARAAAAAHQPSSAASGSTGTLTVPSASSSSFLWEDADVGDAGEEEEEVDCSKQRESTSAAASFSGLLRQLNELEQSVVTWGRKSTGKDNFSPPPLQTAKQRAPHSGGDSNERHGDFSPPPPPPPPLPARPVKQRVVHSGGDGKEGHGNFSPPPPQPPPSLQLQLQTTQQHRQAKNMDEGDRKAGDVPSKQPPPPLSLPPEQQPKAKSTEKGGKKEDVVANIFPTSQAAAPKHRKTKSCDGGSGKVRLEDGSVAVVKQSEDPLSDFRRSMVNMVVENRIATGDELRELLRHFLALNAPHHHDAILRAFTEIWDEAFSAAKTSTPHRDPGGGATRRPTPPRPRTKAPTPPRRRLHAPPPPRVWR